MQKKPTKRHRQLKKAAILGGSFLLVLIGAFWYISPGGEEYIPGEHIAGLTSDLERDLPSDYPKVIFSDVSEEAGINFIHFNGTRTTQLPEDMGSGAAWGDYNNDGWPDLYVVNFCGPISNVPDGRSNPSSKSALFRNNRDGTFADVTDSSQTGLSTWGNAAAWGDYNNDGWMDLVVTAYGTNTLFRNERNGKFTNVSSTSGIGSNSGYWAGASWGDYNKDGFLDLYLCSYVDFTPQETGNVSLQFNAEVPSSINPSSFPPASNLLYLNNGDGTFSEVAEKAGVQNKNGRSLASTWCDFDEDGWPDLYIANDVSDNVFYRNLGNGTFEEISHSAFVADYRGAMGIAVGDWDRDTDMDMFITHWIAQENALYNNLLTQTRKLDISSSGLLRFMDEADRYGLGQSALEFIGFGTFFFDYNNDGLLDLFVSNGSTFQQRDKPELLIPMVDKLYWNRGNGEGFFDVSSVSGDYFRQKFVGRGAAMADYDKDGDLDIYVANNGGPGKLLNNAGGNQGAWLQVKLKGKISNADAIGARIRLVSASGIQVAEVGVQGSYFSQNMLTQHFGLANIQKVDTLEIIWPSGNRQIMYELPVNQTIEIIEENGQ